MDVSILVFKGIVFGGDFSAYLMILSAWIKFLINYFMQYFRYKNVWSLMLSCKNLLLWMYTEDWVSYHRLLAIGMTLDSLLLRSYTSFSKMIKVPPQIMTSYDRICQWVVSIHCNWLMVKFMLASHWLFYRMAS